MNQEKVKKRDLLSILAVALVAFAGILSETSMNVTFPHLSKVFGLSLGVLQWITTGYLLAVAITITLGATLAHNWTERRILFASLSIFTLGNLIAMIAPDFTFLMLGRILEWSSYQSGTSHRPDLRRLHDWLLRLAHDLQLYHASSHPLFFAGLC